MVILYRRCIFSKNILAQASFTHRGSELTSGLNGFIDEEIRTAQLESILAGIKSAAHKATSLDGVEKIKGLLVQASQRKLDGRSDNVANAIAGTLKLSEQNKEAFVMEYLDHSSRTPFGVQAALTAVAQKVGTYDGRIELERLGGDVIGYSDAQWKSIEALAAA